MNDSFHLVQHVKDMLVHQLEMFSLHVSSFCTNVLLRDTLEYICDYTRTHNICICMPLADLKQLLLFCTHNIQLKFIDKIYRQKDGVAIGCPLRPILANIFVTKVENTKPNQFIDGFVVYERYADDMFCVTEENIDLKE